MKRKIIKILASVIITGTVVNGLGVDVNIKNNEMYSTKDYVQLESQAKAHTTKVNIKPKTTVGVELHKKEVRDKKSLSDAREYHNFYLSFYTSLPNENSNDGTGTDDRGKPLVSGDVADNYLSYGTQIHLDGIGIVTARDVGSPVYFKNKYTLDVFVPREDGESNQQYYDRVNSMGRRVVKGYIITVN